MLVRTRYTGYIKKFESDWDIIVQTGRYCSLPEVIKFLASSHMKGVLMVTMGRGSKFSIHNRDNLHCAPRKKMDFWHQNGFVHSGCTGVPNFWICKKTLISKNSYNSCNTSLSPATYQSSDARNDSWPQWYTFVERSYQVRPFERLQSLSTVTISYNDVWLPVAYV